MAPKGQVTTEVLLILAVLLVIIIMFFTLSQSQISIVNTATVQQKATKSIDILSATAKEVYAQGEGARKRVYVDIPEGYDYYNSSVINRTISMRVLGSDFARTMDFDVHGQLPITNGPQWMWVINEGTGVRIGLYLITVNRQAIVTKIIQNSSANDNFAVQNVFNAPINISINLTWNNPNVALTLSQTNFSLSQNSSSIVFLSYITNNITVGYYTGNIAIMATNGIYNDRIDLPITVEISFPVGTTPPLYIVPDYWNAILNPGQNISRTFDICTNSVTTLSGVNFGASYGPPASWITSLTAMPAMPPNICVPKIFTLMVPSNTSGGTYTGAITATGIGVNNAQAQISLNVQVPIIPLDAQGPLVINISKIPNRPFLGDPVTLTAVCDDTNTGNSTILKGEISVDGGAWNTMIPSDGDYNTPTENVSYTYNGLAFGAHTLNLRCTDINNNVGPNSAYQFNIMKEILFITHDEGSTDPEQNWEDWFNTHHSANGFTWNNDIVQRSTVIGPGFNINLYSAAVISDDVLSDNTGAQLITKLNNFMGSGGYVLLIDEAVEFDAAYLGIGSGAYPTPYQYYLAVRNNAHYITSPYPVGNLYVYSYYPSDMYFVNDYAGTTLATRKTNSPLTQAIVGDDGHVLIWGVEIPYMFSNDGDAFASRVFDYAILNSTVGKS